MVEDQLHLGALRNNNARLLGKLGPDEFLLRLSRETVSDSTKDLSKELGLTSRESEVLSWLSKGKTNRDIAQILGLSPRTVDIYRGRLMKKYQAGSTPELINKLLSA